MDYLTNLGRSELTVKAYLADMAIFRDFCPKKPGRISRQDLDAYMGHLRAKGQSPKTIRRRVASVSSFFRYLGYSGRLAKNPAHGLALPKMAQKLPEVLTEAEVASMLSAGGPGPQEALDRLVGELLYSTGGRLAELAGARLSDLDLEAGTLRVVGKGNREAVLLLTNRCKELLRVYVASRTGDDDILLLGAGGRPLGRMGIYRAVKRLAHKSGIGKRVCPHKFRHSIATAMLSRGCDLRSVQEFLRHKSVATTEIYTHVSAERLKEQHRKFHPLP